MITAPANFPTVDNDARVSPRVLSLINKGFDNADIPLSKRWISQGSYHHGSLSGTTHDGGGTADIGHLWQLTSAEIARLVVELRKLGAVAWYRDSSHGGFKAPHLHVVVRGEPDLSPSAAWQIAEYDAGRNGLSGSSAGPDYHPRPAWTLYRLSKWTRITRFPRTGVYTSKDVTSKRAGWKLFRTSVEYVGEERDSLGRLWLKTPAGNWILAKATAVLS